MKSKTAIRPREIGERTFKERLVRDFKMNGALYLIFVPLIVWYILFRYKPMYGLLMAFQDYSPRKGIMGSEWVGLKYFVQFVNDPYFWRLMRNTVVISVTNLIFGFPTPIILALMLNELRCKWFRNGVQTIVYLPHFISIMVICGLVKNFTSDDGLINDIIALFAGDDARKSFLMFKEYYVPIHVLSDIWAGIGWESIIYFAALTGIDQQLYEAAQIDGAGRLKQTWHITLPGIMPTIVTMLILRVGGLLNVGYEKVLLLYNDLTYETADIITTYTYRQAIVDGAGYGYSTAVGLFNSIICFALLIGSNTLSKKLGQSGLF